MNNNKYTKFEYYHNLLMRNYKLKNSVSLELKCEEHLVGKGFYKGLDKRINRIDDEDDDM